METTTLTVKGMSCGHCIKSIEGKVGGLTGVRDVKVNLSEGTVEITYDSEKVSIDQITEEIEDQGYDVA